MVGVLLASPFGRGGCDQREQTERAHPLPCGELPPQRLRGLQIGEARKKCNGDDRRQRRIQGGAVGAAVSRTRVPLKARSGRWAPQPVLAKRLAFFRFDFSFGIIKGEQPLIRGSSASKSPCPCRAEHAAFASQTGLRLKSPTGAFMPSGHRRPFWFSFGAKREQTPPGEALSSKPETFIYLLFFRFHCSRRIHARMLR